MAYRILTKKGIDNTNIDGARGEYFNSGMRDCIVQGALNEGLFIANASNSISLDSCELRIAGHRIIIDEPVYQTFLNKPSSDVRYSFIAQVVIDDSSDVTFSIIVQPSSSALIQNDLYKNLNGAGTYQVEIGRFTLLTDGTITDVIRTIDVITGGSGKGGSGSINVGNVITEKIEPEFNAEVDIDTRYEEDEDKEYIDFKFYLPIDMTETINKSNQALTNSQTAITTANEAKSNSEDALSNSETALSNSQTALTNSSSAVLTAESAETNSNTAISTANNALTVANGIDSKATQALTNSQTAVEIANQSKAGSEEALSNSETALNNSQTAMSNSNSAISTAEGANGKADTAIATANNAKSDSQIALSNSESAVNTSTTANSNSNSALSNSQTAINTANEAKEAANEALEQVVAGLGTKVYVNNNLQNRLDFTEDPQTQINNIMGQVEANTDDISTLLADVEELGNKLNTTNANVNSEITNRQNADTTLQNNINIEKTARENADNNLQTQINNKANSNDVVNLSSIQTITASKHFKNASFDYINISSGVGTIGARIITNNDTNTISFRSSSEKTIFNVGESFDNPYIQVYGYNAKIIYEKKDLSNGYYIKYTDGSMEQHFTVTGTRGSVTTHNFLTAFKTGTKPYVCRTVEANGSGNAQRLDGNNVKNVDASTFQIYTTDIPNATTNFIHAYGYWK